jgi:hypothetical protein
MNVERHDETGEKFYIPRTRPPRQGIDTKMRTEDGAVRMITYSGRVSLPRVSIVTGIPMTSVPTSPDRRQTTLDVKISRF